MYIGIDLSLRNTGIVVLDNERKLIDFAIISNKKIDEEELLDKNTKDILKFISKYDITRLAIEGLSFISKSGSKDIIDGNFWFLRVNLKKKFKKLTIEILPVSKWRKLVISKERVKELEKEIGEVTIVKTKKGKSKKKVKMPKSWQKNETVRCLPVEVKKRFEEYLIVNKCKKDSVYDLADAYFITNFLITGDNKNAN